MARSVGFSATAGAQRQSGSSSPKSASKQPSYGEGDRAAMVATGQKEKQLLSDYSEEFIRYQAQKHRSRGGVEARIILNLCMYYGEQYAQQAYDAILTRPLTDEDKNRLHLIFNLTKKQTKRAVGRLASVAPVHSATPMTRDPQAYAMSDVVTQLVTGLNRRLGERTQNWLRLWWAAVGGVSIEHTPWVPNAIVEPVPQYDDDNTLLWKDQMSGQVLTEATVTMLVQQGAPPERFVVLETLQMTGDVGSEVLSPLNFFIDASVPFIRKLGPGQSCMIGEIKTREWIIDTFGSDVVKKLAAGRSDTMLVKSKLLEKGPTYSNVSMRDLIPAVQGVQGPNDPPIDLVITRYAPPTKGRPHGGMCIFIPDIAILDEQELPYSEIPCNDFHWEPPTTSFWTGDFITDMVPAQKFLNKRMSQLGEAANAQLYELLLLGPELGKEDIPTDVPGVVQDGLNQDGNPQVATLPRGQLPTFFLDSIRMIIEYIQEVGGSDVFSRKNFPGQLRGPLAVPMLQELLDSENGPFYEHYGEQLERVYQQRVNRVKEFYPPLRTLHFTGKGGRDEVLQLHTDVILRSGVEYRVKIDRGSLAPEFKALNEAKIRERLNSPLAILYINRRTGMLDPSKIAKDLHYTEEGREERESQARKFCIDLIGRVWRGAPPPKVQPFYDHEAMMDELEAVFMTTEFIDASPDRQNVFFAWYEQHRQGLIQQQQASQDMINNQMMQGAVAQATQQAAAKAASAATDAALGQVQAQHQLASAGGPGGAGAGALPQHHLPEAMQAEAMRELTGEVS